MEVFRKLRMSTALTGHMWPNTTCSINDGLRNGVSILPHDRSGKNIVIRVLSMSFGKSTFIGEMNEFLMVELKVPPKPPQKPQKTEVSDIKAGSKEFTHPRRSRRWERCCCRLCELQPKTC